MRASDFARRVARNAGAAALLLLPLLSSAVHADAGSDAALLDRLRSTITDLHAAQDQNAELNAKVQALTAELAQRPAAPAAATPAVDEAQAQQLRSEQARNQSLQKEMKKLETLLAGWQQSYQQAASLARSRDADAKRLDVLYKDAESGRQGCFNDNVDLVGISNDLLSLYRHKGVLSAARDQEPLTGLSRVKLETLAQTYHSKIVDATVVPTQTDSQSPQSETSPPP